jgi:hypothetical protein
MHVIEPVAWSSMPIQFAATLCVDIRRGPLRKKTLETRKVESSANTVSVLISLSD